MAAFYEVLAPSYPRASIFNEVGGRKFFDHMLELATDESNQNDPELVINCELDAAEYVIASGFTDDLETALEIVSDFEELKQEEIKYGQA